MIWSTKEGSMGENFAGLYSRPNNIINSPDFLNNLNSNQFDTSVKDISAKSYVIKALKDLHSKYEHFTKLLDECKNLPQKIKNLENDFDYNQMFIYRLNNINVDIAHNTLDDILNTIRSITMVSSFISAEKDNQQYDFDCKAQNDFYKYQLDIINNDQSLFSKKDNHDFPVTIKKSYEDEIIREDIEEESKTVELENEYKKLIDQEIETSNENQKDSANQRWLKYMESNNETSNNETSNKEFEEYETITAE